MHIHGVVRTADLAENPPGSDQIEMVVRVQGVGAGQPRLLVIPFGLLVDHEEIEPETVAGRGFEAEIDQDEHGRWIIHQIAFTSRVLRPSD